MGGVRVPEAVRSDGDDVTARPIRGWRPLPVVGRPKVSIAVATYDQRDELACLLYSFRAQTYSNWEAVVVHDGPGPVARDVVAAIGDDRVRLIETPERKQQYGHPWRDLGIFACTGDYIGLTNGDNYYAPVYFEWMLHLLTARGADLVYCDMVHSHFQWSAFGCAPAKGTIDLGCWVARADLVKATPWRDHGFLGDGTYVEDLCRKATTVMRIPKPLFVHN
jgi:glycosyltransferase involved in cell wall biosynthesis